MEIVVVVKAGGERREARGRNKNQKGKDFLDTKSVQR